MTRQQFSLKLALIALALALAAFVMSVASMVLSITARGDEPTEPATEMPQVIEPAQIVEPVCVEVTPEEPEPVEAVPAYTEQDLELLAMAIYAEAGGDACSDETRLMVGNVVLNRVADSRFPDTLAGVLTQKSQYAHFSKNGLTWPKRASQQVEAHAVARAYECAERLLNGERVLPEGVIFQAEFTQGTEVVAHQDNLYFCR